MRGVPHLFAKATAVSCMKTILNKEERDNEDPTQ